jgi:hypothetical protein
MSSVATLDSARGRTDGETAVRAFEAGEIDPQHFNHAAHVHIAWCYLQQFPTAMAIAKFTSALRSLTERLGVPQKYHETMSWFFVIVIADRLAHAPGGDWESFKRDNRDLFEGGAELVRRHYTKARLDSAEARQRFLLPDVTPGA